MKTYNVLWCDVYDTCGGCVTVHADNEQDAVARARSILQMGCNFRLVRVYEKVVMM